MIIDTHVDKKISEEMRRLEIESKPAYNRTHILTASSIYNPLQWQMLHHLGVPSVEKDDFSLRKFLRGREVEDWLMRVMPDTIPQSSQKVANYRGVRGLMDGLVDTSKWDFPRGKAVMECKSVANAKFKRLKATSEPDRGHMLQAGVYALSEGLEWCVIIYVAADDLRTLVYQFPVSDVQEEIDAIIDAYDRHKEMKLVPVFEAREVWQGNPMYNPYPDWKDLTQEEINEKLTKLGYSWNIVLPGLEIAGG